MNCKIKVVWVHTVYQQRRLYQKDLPRVALLREAGGRDNVPGRGGTMFTGMGMETVPGYLSVQSPLSLQSALLAGQFCWYLLQLIIASHVSFPQTTEGSSHCVCSMDLSLWPTLETGSQNPTTSGPHSTYPKDIKSEKKNKERKKKVFHYNLLWVFLPAPLLPLFLALLICCLCWFMWSKGSLLV